MDAWMNGLAKALCIANIKQGLHANARAHTVVVAPNNNITQNGRDSQNGSGRIMRAMELREVGWTGDVREQTRTLM